MYESVYVCFNVNECVCVCVCVRERERERRLMTRVSDVSWPSQLFVMFLSLRDVCNDSPFKRNHNSAAAAAVTDSNGCKKYQQEQQPC